MNSFRVAGKNSRMTSPKSSTPMRNNFRSAEIGKYPNAPPGGLFIGYEPPVQQRFLIERKDA
jgi:hypothetical protein